MSKPTWRRAPSRADRVTRACWRLARALVVGIACMGPAPPPPPLPRPPPIEARAQERDGQAEGEER